MLGLLLACLYEPAWLCFVLSEHYLLVESCSGLAKLCHIAIFGFCTFSAIFCTFILCRMSAVLVLAFFQYFFKFPKEISNTRVETSKNNLPGISEVWSETCSHCLHRCCCLPLTLYCRAPQYAQCQYSARGDIRHQHEDVITMACCVSRALMEVAMGSTVMATRSGAWRAGLQTQLPTCGSSQVSLIF